VLLADEPTGNLDEASAGEILELFHIFNQVGVTVVVATHDRAVHARLRGRTLTVAGGKVIEGPVTT